ncbi:homoserine O-acetyltransferase [Actinomycetospora lutea]|uniref:homoserine O-acetyltransferase MetX n=1 Tax=Actinomycetospora lutea TaxID=663604 RepID=UPI002366EC12|nr:homoserine O-acetyltransferase [Actinomycetospora lutea]MDD7939916.1 homoserine O-acetyltransferase [Actinomycetospora lutea]
MTDTVQTVPVLPPATGAWREGDPVGDRLFLDVGAVTLESGETIPDVRVAYETWGRFDGSNAVLVLHALTGDSHVTGEAGLGHPTPGWWSGLIGPGRAVDTDRWFVVAPNVLGGCQGTTGPSTPAPDGRPWGSRFPRTTVRDQVVVEEKVADALGIDRWAAVLGGSMGGMRALEWAVMYPSRVERLLLLCSPAAASADQIAWASPQIAAIVEDAGWHGGDYHDLARGEGPHRGLGVARRIAHNTYRTAEEYDTRFARRPQPGEDPDAGGRFAMESYLDHHAEKLVHRFDAASYVELTRAMNGHDVARGRGSSAEVLAGVTARTVVAGSISDRLYPLHQQEELAALIPGAGEVWRIESPFGHDAFLIEARRLTEILGELFRA